MNKIVLCHLDSLTCLPALNLVFAELGGRIGLVLSSRRFASKHGGFWRQTRDSFRRLGVPLTLYLGFDLISVQVVSRLARRPALATLADLARRHGARLIETGDVNAADTLAAMRAYAPDLVLVMNFDQILEAPLIAVPRLGTVNIHPSLLPALRGPCPVIWALAQKRPTSGATIHLIDDEKIDAGPVLAQVEVPIHDDPSVAELNTRLFLAGAGALRAALEQMDRPWKPGEGQYLGFPTAAEMMAMRRSGVRLIGIRHCVRLIGAALGLMPWKSG